MGCRVERFGIWSVALALHLSSTASLPLSDLPGDASCDGVISNQDITAEIRVIFGEATACPENADPINDGQATAADLVFVLQSSDFSPQPSPTPSATATGTATSTETATPSPTPSASPTTTPTQSRVPTATATTGSVSFDQIQTQIFDAGNATTGRCTQDFCHSGQFPQGDLSLEADKSYDQLVDVQPVRSSARSRGLLRIAPGDLQKSFLWLKVLEFSQPGSLQFGDGSPMPQVGNPLPQEQLNLLRDWIQAGAPR